VARRTCQLPTSTRLCRRVGSDGSWKRGIYVTTASNSLPFGSLVEVGSGAGSAAATATATATAANGAPAHHPAHPNSAPALKLPTAAVVGCREKPRVSGKEVGGLFAVAFDGADTAQGVWRRIFRFLRKLISLQQQRVRR